MRKFGVVEHLTKHCGYGHFTTNSLRCTVLKWAKELLMLEKVFLQTGQTLESIFISGTLERRSDSDLMLGNDVLLDFYWEMVKTAN